MAGEAEETDQEGGFRILLLLQAQLIFFFFLFVTTLFALQKLTHQLVLDPTKAPDAQSVNYRPQDTKKK